MEIGKKIRDARIQSGLTQEQAALEIMVSRQTISNWENCKSLPDIISVLKMSDLYQISLDDLIKGDDEMRKQIEMDTDIVGTSRRLITIGWSLVVIMVLLVFAGILSGNTILYIINTMVSWIFIAVAAGCYYAVRNRGHMDEPERVESAAKTKRGQTGYLKTFGGIALMMCGIMCVLCGIYLIPATMWRPICAGLFVIGVIAIIIGIIFLRRK